MAWTELNPTSSKHAQNCELQRTEMNVTERSVQIADLHSALLANRYFDFLIRIQVDRRRTEQTELASSVLFSSPTCIDM